jgi:hypothetical protein
LTESAIPLLLSQSIVVYSLKSTGDEFMNTRCYRCGWSFSLSREALEEAAVSSAGQKAHVIHCPRCRQAIRIPMDQILRDLPPGWTPSAAAGEPAQTAGEPANQSAEEQSANPAPISEPAQAPERHQRRHRHTGKINTGDSAAVPAAKKSTHAN